MCCLFGLIDYRDTLSRRQKTKMVRALAETSEARGRNRLQCRRNTADP